MAASPRSAGNMQRLPLPPRLARILLEACGAIEGCAACAWLAEPARLGGPTAATTSDLLTVIDRWREMPRHLKTRRRSSRPSRGSRIGGPAGRCTSSETELRRALLTGYPDRVARRRAADKATLASGHGAIIGRESGVHDAEWLIALDVTAGARRRQREAIIRVASRIEPEWLSPTRSTVEQEIDESGALKARAVDWYDALVLAERPVGVNADMTSRGARGGVARARARQAQRPADGRLAFAGLDVDLSGSVIAAAQHARRVQDIVLTEEQLPWDVRQRLARRRRTP